jgi:hypothetical protein
VACLVAAYSGASSDGCSDNQLFENAGWDVLLCWLYWSSATLVRQGASGLL